MSPPPATCFQGLEPAGFWQHFAAISCIPRPSRHEQKAAAYVITWAHLHGFESRQDSAGNLLVQVPASPGRQSAPRVILQGHLDMVCERTADSSCDAASGHILIRRDGDWIIAPQTTLGADNGAGVAAMLHFAQQSALPHGPLDLLLTVEEETGQQGAANLDPAFLDAPTLINLDSEDDAALIIGCAGGIDTQFSFAAPRQNLPPAWHGTTVRISGLRGGHSGCDINKPRLNALKALTRILQSAPSPLLLSTIDGGSRRNAIPRDAAATIFHPADRTREIHAAFTHTAAQLTEQYRGHDDNLALAISDAPPAATVFPESDSRRLLDFLRTLPSGVITMNPDMPGFVQSSTNLAVIQTAPDESAQGKIAITSLSRSSDPLAHRDILDSLQSAARLANASARESAGYPGWKPNLHSPLLAAARNVYQKLFNTAPQIAATHGGLECGLFAAKAKKNLDMISLGPTILGPHAPGEKISIPSVQKFTRLLPALLDSLSQP